MTLASPLLADATRDLHYNTLVVDALEAAPMTPAHFARLRQAGVHCVNYTATSVNAAFPDALLGLARFISNMAQRQNEAVIATTTTDIHHAREAGKIALLMGAQNTNILNDKVENVALVHAIGVRVIQLTYNERNAFGDGCVEPSNAGLSRLGKKLVAEMNRWGVIVDLSHCGERTTMDAIEASSDPVLITHSNAKALCPSPRNKSDEVIKRLAERQGVMGVAVWAPMAYSDPNQRPTIDDVLNHIDHIVQTAGIDHVAIGTDLGEGESRDYWDPLFDRVKGIYPEVTGMMGEWFEFPVRMVEGLDSVVGLPAITEGLAQRGYQPADIRKILGGNVMRVLAQVIDR